MANNDKRFFERKCSAKGCWTLILIPCKMEEGELVPLKENPFGFFCKEHGKVLNSHLKKWNTIISGSEKEKKEFIDEITKKYLERMKEIKDKK